MSSIEGDTELICAVRAYDYNKIEKLINLQYQIKV
jgi:hypothetical protein